MVPVLRPDALGDRVDRLYRAAWALCGNHHDAEDLVQETYAKLLSKSRWIDRDDELGYLLATLRNVFLDGVRAKGRRPQTVELGDDGDTLTAVSSASAHDVASAREVFAHISALPEDFRDVVIAVDVVGLSYAEAATALKIKQGTVMSRLSRGRGRLAKDLAPAG